VPPNEPSKQIKPTKLGDYLDVMSKAVFQTSISWKVVEFKRLGLQEAFKGLNPGVVNDLLVPEVQALVRDTRIIRNRRKIEDIIHNAQRLLALEHEHGSFQAYLRAKGGDFNALVKDMRKNCKFLGDMGAFYFLSVVGEKDPGHKEFMAAC
jgi:DNA-3-methyladenine glycosylase I